MQTPTPAPGAKSIPLQSVRDVLMFHRVRRVAARTGQQLARCAAFTQNPHLNDACREAQRYGRPSARMRLCLTFGPMHAGDLQRVIERTRQQHGVAEVRRTWGQGVRALEKQLKGSGGVMR